MLVSIHVSGTAKRDQTENVKEMTFYRELANIYLLLVDVEMLSKNIKALKR
jgi:hypothetical protein